MKTTSKILKIWGINCKIGQKLEKIFRTKLQKIYGAKKGGGGEVKKKTPGNRGGKTQICPGKDSEK